MSNDYTIPRYGTTGQNLLSWCLEAVQEGDGWLKAQQPASDWERALKALSGPEGGARIENTSNTGYRKVKRTARELVASLGQFKHEGEFKVTWNEELSDQADTLTNLDRNWYRKCKVHEPHRAAIQYAVATGTSYLMETWNKSFHGHHRGDIQQVAISPNDITFVQLPRDHDIQKAYGVIWREELPVNLAKAIYGPTNRAFAEGLVADRQKQSWLTKGLQAVQQFIAPALRYTGRMQEQAGSYPTVDIYHLYTMDGALNDGPLPVKMGSLGTNWAYDVPALNDPIPTGIMNPATGNEFTRPATMEDCRMFPLRRYTIFARTGVCYDGSSPWWHGQVPVARLRFGDWAWEALGSSQVADIIAMEEGIIALMRGIENAMAARLDPPMLYDDTLVSRSWAHAFNASMAGARAAAPLMSGKPIEYPVPPEYYNVPQNIPAWIESQESRMDYMTGVRDLVAIAKAKQIPGADALEKLMEMAGPIVQDLVGAIANPLQELGEWRKAYYYQFYTRARMITITGPEGVDIDTQFRPEQLVPRISGEGPEQLAKRSRGLLDNFHYEVTESGINEINRMSTKLLYLQLYKLSAGGMPIVSRHTLARICQIPNYGPPPEGTNNEQERIVAEQVMNMELQIELAQKLQAAQGGGPMGGPANPVGATQTPSGQQGAGRPQSLQEAPRIVTKEGGARSTVTTSR